VRRRTERRRRASLRIGLGDAGAVPHPRAGHGPDPGVRAPGASAACDAGAVDVATGPALPGGGPPALSRPSEAVQAALPAGGAVPVESAADRLTFTSARGALRRGRWER